MKKGIYTFLESKGIYYSDTGTTDPYDLLLTIDDAETFLKIAATEHIAIIGADVRERKGKDRYVITRNTIGLEWSCMYDNDSVTDDSYIDRSIKTAEIALCKIRDIIKENNKHLLKRNKQLFINYVFHDKDMENSTELFNL
jgi:hypothetical protein